MRVCSCGATPLLQRFYRAGGAAAGANRRELVRGGCETRVVCPSCGMRTATHLSGCGARRAWGEDRCYQVIPPVLVGSATAALGDERTRLHEVLSLDAAGRLGGAPRIEPDYRDPSFLQRPWERDCDLPGVRR